MRKNIDAIYWMVRLLQGFMIAGFANLSFDLSMGPCVLFNDNVVQDTSHYLLGFCIVLLGAMPCAIAFGDSRAMVVFAAICSLVSLYNFCGLAYAGTVVVMRDFWNGATLRHIIDKYSLSLPISGIVIALLCVAMVICSRLVDRMLKERKRPRRRQRMMFCAVDVAVLSFVLALSSGIGSNEDIWSWEEYYYTHGMVMGMIGNIAHGNAKAIMPEGYGQEEIALCAPIEAKVEEYPDIVFILDETYYDLGHLANIETDADYMKNYRRLSCFKGFAAVPVVGGGTNTSEYELLTENSLSLLRTYSPYNNIPLSNAWSIVRYLKNLGYATMGAHPEMSANYHRGMAWQELGFDDARFAQDFVDLAYDAQRPRATDHSVFESFKRFYEEMPEDKPRFAFLITIQNHGPYDNPGEDRVHAIGEGRSSQVNEYLTSVQLTDSFIPEVTAYFNQSKRNVVVCLVGDHAPAFVNMYHEKGDSYLKERQVPYLIWSNASDTLSLDLKSDIDLCALGAYALHAGGLPLSSYQSSLIALSQYAQCFTNVSIPKGKTFGDVLGYIDENGDVHDANEETKAGNLLRNYLYAEYSLLKGKPSQAWVIKKDR